MATIAMSGLRKVYPNGYEAVHGINLDIADGEFVVLVGPSGCGKTTILRMVAGLEEISSGDLRIDDRVVNDVSPEDRDIAMVFQNYALYPHMTVGENIGFSLKLRRMPKGEIRKRVEDAAQALGLSEWLDRKPGLLSGGQRQRVAMGRAIVREPSVFLMDEPLSNLDAKLRVQMRAEVSRIQQRLGVATLYVTHDQIEAMTMGTRVAVMRSGSVEQVASPQDLYDHPKNLFVAGFIGSPSINLFEAALSEGGDSLRLGTQEIALPPAVLDSHPALRSYAGRPLIVGLRPEHLPAAGPGDATVIAADVDLLEALGSEQLVHFSIDAKRVTTEGATEEEEQLTARGAGVARVDPRQAIRPGDRVSLTVDIGRAHFFDIESEQAL